MLPKAPSLEPVVRLVYAKEKPIINYEIKALDQLIESSRDIYTLKKKVAYLMAFISLVISKAKKTNFEKPNLGACYLDRVLLKVVKYDQSQNYGAADEVLKNESPDKFDLIIKRLSNNVIDSKEKKAKKKLKKLDRKS